MSAPTLTTTQKQNLRDLMTEYLTGCTTYLQYRGKARRESYAYTEKIADSSSSIAGCMDSSTNKYFLNCGLFAQMIWMGRSFSDFKNTSPKNSITKAFDWGYYFDFLQARYAYGKMNGSNYYTLNTFDTSTGKGFITFDNAAAMAEELYEKGYEIPYSESDIGDLVFYRAESITDGDKDATEESSFRNISHVGIVYDKTTEGYPIILECTNVYSNKVMGKCGSSPNNGVVYGTSAVTTFGKIRGANLGFRNVMCARHPAAFGHNSNVPLSFKTYRGTNTL